jgi:hypothetical protein
MSLQLLQIDLILVVMMVALIIMNWQLRAIRKCLSDIRNRMPTGQSSDKPHR